MKVVREAPTLRSRRLIMPEHGFPYQARASWGRRHRSSRRSHDLEGETGKTSCRAVRPERRKRRSRWRAGQLE
jgi:hypothetical protein